jgi:hypothetical protein
MDLIDATFRPSGIPTVELEPDGTIEVVFAEPSSSSLTILLTSEQAKELLRQLPVAESKGQFG